MTHYIQYNLAGFVKKLGPFSEEEAKKRLPAIEAFEGITDVRILRKKKPYDRNTSRRVPEVPDTPIEHARNEVYPHWR